MSDIRYIGAFPPPYGGVTVKNNMIYSQLRKQIDVTRVFFQHRIMKQTLDVLWLFFWRKAFIIGVSASKGKSKWITTILYWLNRNAMNRSLYFMMGGLEADYIAENQLLIKKYSEYKQIYVETESMKKVLSDSGMKNVSVFPNCRIRPVRLPSLRDSEEKLKCVFFSNIQKSKGVDTILRVSEGLLSVEFYLYGYIDAEYTREFDNLVKNRKNVCYKGVFSGNAQDVIEELNKYDVLLFPTRWKTEGVPGVLVESKIAGIPAVVTDVCYNAEIVTNGEDGIVVPLNNEMEFQRAIEELDRDRERLRDLKEKARESAERFYVDNYIEKIIRKL